MSLHNVSHTQVQRVTTLLASGQPPKDLRGLHNNRPQRKSDDLIMKIRKHVESLPVKTSYYASKTVGYLVKAIHALFLKKHPDLTDKIKYKYFLQYFNENYNLNLEDLKWMYVRNVKC